MPHLLHCIHVELESLCQRELRKPCRHADAQLSRRELQECVASACIEMIEHLRERARSLRSAEARQAFDDVRDAQCTVIDLRRLRDLLGPEQGDGFGQVADIIPAHVEERWIDPLLGDPRIAAAFTAGRLSSPVSAAIA